MRRSPTLTSSSASCVRRTDAGRAAGRPTAEPRARHAALAADHAALGRRLHPARRGDRRGPLDHRSDPHRRHACSIGSGIPTTAGSTRPPRTPKPSIVRQKDLADNATPSANSTAAIALFRLAALTGEQRYAHQADRILQLIGAAIDKSPAGHTNALAAADLRRRGLTEVVIVGERHDLVRLAQSVWRPDTVLAWGEPYDSPLWADRPTASATSAVTTPVRRHRTPCRDSPRP